MPIAFPSVQEHAHARGLFIFNPHHHHISTREEKMKTTLHFVAVKPLKTSMLLYKFFVNGYDVAQYMLTPAYPGKIAFMVKHGFARSPEAVERLSNLIADHTSNDFKFTPDGFKVTVDAGVLQEAIRLESIPEQPPSVVENDTLCVPH